jgi:CRISPR system Cascade subunit CasD
VAAALGLRRYDEPAHAVLADNLRFAIRIESPGHLLVDYHTSQTAPTPQARPFATRREVLAATEVHTILSRREYRTDFIATVVIAAVGASVSLDEIAEALQRPRFTLYLGRKSCPLALPLCPRLVEAADVIGALAAGDAAEPDAAVQLRRETQLKSAPVYLAVDEDIAPKTGKRRIERRRDRVLHRGRRQFAPRTEAIIAFDPQN